MPWLPTQEGEGVKQSSLSYKLDSCSFQDDGCPMPVPFSTKLTRYKSTVVVPPSEESDLVYDNPLLHHEDVTDQLGGEEPRHPGPQDSRSRTLHSRDRALPTGRP